MFKTVLTSIGIFFLISLEVASANTLAIRPFLLDLNLQQREATTETILVTNDKSYKQAIFATVNEISVDDTGEIKKFESPAMSDRTNTVTSWISVTRGRIEIDPGGEVEVPLTIKVPPNAVAGEYHAFIGFVPTSKRFQAEAKALAGEADGVIVKVTIKSTDEEYIRISGFMVDRFITSDDKRLIEIEVDNVGDITTVPTGELIFFNSRGEEVTSIPVNEQALAIRAGESDIITAEVPLESTIGRYKANLSLQYGENQRATVYDSTQFYMLPLHILILVFGVVLLLIFFLILLFRRAGKHAPVDMTEGEELSFYVRDGHEPNPQDHDIDLKENNS